MKTAQLKLAHYNFSIIDDLSCEKYVEEENDYFKHLQNTGFAYPTEAPPAIAPIFENNPNGLSWLQVTFKKQNKNKIKKQIAELEEKINDCKPTSGTSSTQINVMLSRTQSSSAIETHGKRAMHPTPLDTMSPRTAKRVMTFLNSYAKSPKSPEEKEQALKKLDEATSILSM